MTPAMGTAHLSCHELPGNSPNFRTHPCLTKVIFSEKTCEILTKIRDISTTSIWPAPWCLATRSRNFLNFCFTPLALESRGFNGGVEKCIRGMEFLGEWESWNPISPRENPEIAPKFPSKFVMIQKYERMTSPFWGAKKSHFPSF